MYLPEYFLYLPKHVLLFLANGKLKISTKLQCIFMMLYALPKVIFCERFTFTYFRKAKIFRCRHIMRKIILIANVYNVCETTVCERLISPT